jgi:transcription factor STE12
MYPQNATMAGQQIPETFMLSAEAQQSLPQDAQVALQQVDNREWLVSKREQCSVEGRHG